MENPVAVEDACTLHDAKPERNAHVHTVGGYANHLTRAAEALHAHNELVSKSIKKHH